MKVVFFISIIFLNGCSIYKILQTPDELTPFPNDQRVWYEQGAYQNAKTISEALDNSIEQIEHKQFRPFNASIEIYVFSKHETFDHYAVHNKAAGETHASRKTLISPKLSNTDERLPRLLTHELSHYHLFSHTGIYDGLVLPTWFIEGLAVWASNGGGAERVSKEQAIHALLSGDHINITTRRVLFFGEKSKPFKMEQHMFYRQSGLFVEYLHNKNEENFKSFLLKILDGESFESTFVYFFNDKPKTAWIKFVKSLKTN